MTIIGDAWVAIRPKTDNFEAEATNSLTTAVKKVAVAVGAAAGLHKIFDITSAAYTAALESQKIGKQTEAVIRSTGQAAGVTADQVSELTTALSRKTRTDDEAIQTGTNLLLTFKNIRNGVDANSKIFDRANEVMIDMSYAMKTSIPSAAETLGRALNDPARGLQLLTRQGVAFTEAEEEVIKSLVETGRESEAQAILLDKLAERFAGSAEAQTTAMDGVRVAIGNVQESFGALFIPAVESAANMALDYLIPALQATVDFLGDEVAPALSDAADFVVDVLQAAFEGLSSYFTDNLIPVFEQVQWTIDTVLGRPMKDFAAWATDLILPAWKGLVAWVNDTLLGMFRDVAEGADTATSSYGKLTDAMKDPSYRDAVTRFGDEVNRVYGTVVIPVLDEATTKFQDLTDFLHENEAAVTAVATAVGTLIAAYEAYAAVTNVAVALKALGVSLGFIAGAGGLSLVIAGVAALAIGFYLLYTRSETFREGVQAVGRVLADVAAEIRDRAQPVIEALGRAFEATAAFIRDDVVPVFITVGEVVADVVSTIVDVAQRIADVAGPPLARLGKAFADTFAFIRDHVVPVFTATFGLVAAILGRLEQIWNAVWPVLHTIIDVTWKAISRVVEQAMIGIRFAIELGMRLIENLWRPAWTILSTIVEFVFDSIRIPIETALGVIRGIIEVFTGLISGDWSKMWEGLQHIVEAVWDGIRGLVETAMELVQGLITGGWDAVIGLWRTIWATIQEIPGLVLDVITNLLGGFVDIGKRLFEGLWESMQGVFALVVDWLAQLPIRVFEAIGDVARTLAPKGWDLIVGIVTGLGEKVIELDQWIRSLPGQILDAAVDLGTALVGKGGELIEKFLGAAQMAAFELYRWFKDLPGRLLDEIGDIAVRFLHIGQSIIDGIIEGIKDAPGDIGDAIWNEIKGGGDSVVDLIRGKSPSELFAEWIGVPIITGVAKGISDEGSSVGDAMMGVLGQLREVDYDAYGHPIGFKVGTAVGTGLEAAVREIDYDSFGNPIGFKVSAAIAAGIEEGAPEIDAALARVLTELQNTYDITGTGSVIGFDPGKAVTPKSTKPLGGQLFTPVKPPTLTPRAPTPTTRVTNEFNVDITVNIDNVTSENAPETGRIVAETAALALRRLVPDIRGALIGG